MVETRTSKTNTEFCAACEGKIVLIFVDLDGRELPMHFARWTVVPAS
jgi:hypothetical protein